MRRKERREEVTEKGRKDESYGREKCKVMQRKKEKKRRHGSYGREGKLWKGRKTREKDMEVMEEKNE